VGPQLRTEVASDGEIRLGSRSVGNIGTGIKQKSFRVTITTSLNDTADTGTFSCQIINKTFITNANFDANGAANLRASFKFGLYYNDPMPKDISSTVSVRTLN
jgi:hypothetical protein